MCSKINRKEVSIIKVRGVNYCIAYPIFMLQQKKKRKKRKTRNHI